MLIRHVQNFFYGIQDVFFLQNNILLIFCTIFTLCFNGFPECNSQFSTIYILFNLF